MVFYAFVRASATPHGSISFDRTQRVDPSGCIAYTFHHILCVGVRQKDGRNDFSTSTRPLIFIERFPALEIPGSVKEHL